jgi:hypothetical protein
MTDLNEPVQKAGRTVLGGGALGTAVTVTLSTAAAESILRSRAFALGTHSYREGARP